jgi:thiol-disulfide isomerase/thioredoxin
LLAALGAGARPLPGDFPGDLQERHVDERGLDIRTISEGQEVSLQRHLVRGKVTIFDYTAEWCKPCRILGGKLAELARREKRIAIRKIDVTEWNAPVVRQHLTGIKGLPYVEVFDRKGRRVISLQIPQVWKIEEVVRPLLSAPRAKSAPASGASSAARRRKSPPSR